MREHYEFGAESERIDGVECPLTGTAWKVGRVEELTRKLRGSRNRIQEHGERGRGTITADRVINNAVQIGVRTSTDTGDQLGK